MGCGIFWKQRRSIAVGWVTMSLTVMSHRERLGWQVNDLVRVQHATDVETVC